MIRLRRLRGSEFARDTAWSFAIKVGSRGLGFAVAVALARFLGAEGYGIYSYALAVVMLLALPAMVGFPTLLMRETARGLASNQPHVVRGVWTWAGKATGVLSLLLGLGGLIVVMLVNDGTLDEQAITLMWALVLVPFVALGALRAAALLGLGRIVAGQLPDDFVRPAILLALVISISFVTDLSPSDAMIMHVVAAMTAFGIGAWLLLRNTPQSVRESDPRSDAKSWLKASIPLALIAGVATVNSQADILVLGIFESPDQVGIYRVAVQVAALASFGLQAINIVVAPRIARLYARGEIESLQRLITLSTRAAAAFSIVAVVLFLASGQPLLGFVFGEEFSLAYLPLLIILIGEVVNSTAGSVGHLLNMTGHERDSLNAILVAASLNVALDFALIPSWGVEGAAVATAVSLATRNIWMCVFVWRRLGINSLAFGPRPKRRPNTA